jgi:hypothetical protein
MPVGRPEQCYISHLILNLVEVESAPTERATSVPLLRSRIRALIIATSGMHHRLKRSVDAIPFCKHFPTETTVKPLASSHLVTLTLTVCLA